MMFLRNTRFLIPLLSLFLAGCAVGKYIPEGEYFYNGTKKINYQDKAEPSQNGDLAKADLTKVLGYKPNGAIFGSNSLRLPFTYPFWINQNLKDAKTAFGKWIYKRFGSEPILVSTVNPPLRAQIGNQLLHQYGYFSSSVTSRVLPLGKDSVSANVAYDVTFGPVMLIDSVKYDLPKSLGDSLELFAPKDRLIKKGEPFGVPVLENERIRISSKLRDKGYYFFTPDLIRYSADTLQVPGRAQLIVEMSDEVPPEAYEPWKIGTVTLDLIPSEPLRRLTDSLDYEGLHLRFSEKRPSVRPGTLANAVKIKSGELYHRSRQEATLAALSDLNTFAYSSIGYTPRKSDSGENLLDVVISATLDQRYSTELNAVYKFKSNNQTGPGLGFKLDRKNIFHGGELLSLEAQGSYEWETRRPTTDRKSAYGINSYAFTLTSALTFPKLLFPWLYSRDFSYPNHTRLALSGTVLNRSNFYGQAQFSGELSYRFEPRSNIRHTIQLLSLTYNHMLYRTERFDEAIAQNRGLALSFQNQFIPQITYLYNYEYQDPLSRHFLSLDAYLGEAGGALSLFYKRNPEAEYQNHRFLRALFAQFVKGYGEVRYAYKFSPDFSIASRFYGGAVYSYGNTGATPYTEQFYAGGANSLRGFNVRSVGPGAYAPEVELPLSFLDRTGDMRLEANLEARYKVIGDLEMALFADAGNIWLLRPTDEKPGGAFDSKYFLKDVALSAGVGVRYDLSFLVLRLDLGVALHRPDRSGGPYFNTFGKSQLPFAVHLAIGYPF